MKYYSLSLTVIVYKHMHCQKVTAWIRCDCEVKNIFLWLDRSHESLVERHDQNFLELNVWLQLHTFHLKIHRWGTYVDWKQNHKYTKILIFFSSWNLFSNFFIETESKAAYVFTVHRTVFSQCAKMHEIIRHTLSLPASKLFQMLLRFET